MLRARRSRPEYRKRNGAALYKDLQAIAVRMMLRSRRRKPTGSLTVYRGCIAWSAVREGRAKDAPFGGVSGNDRIGRNRVLVLILGAEPVGRLPQVNRLTCHDEIRRTAECRRLPRQLFDHKGVVTGNVSRVREYSAHVHVAEARFGTFYPTVYRIRGIVGSGLSTKRFATPLLTYSPVQLSPRWNNGS